VNDTATREPAELRLLDVLLEEELQRQHHAAAQRPSAPRGRRVLTVAAVLLLGVGVVLGVLVGGRGEQTALPANQQGGEREEVTPESAQQLAELLPKLESVVVTSLRSERPRAGFPGLREWQADFLDPAARVSIADPVQLVRWMDALRAACGAAGTRAVRDLPPDCEVRLQLHGARAVRLRLTDSALQCSPAICLAVDGALLQLLNAGRFAADRHARLLRGRAMDAEELRLLPTDLRELTCFLVDANDLAAALPRFPQLEQLRCYPGGRKGQARALLPVLTALAPLRTLRSLRIPADLLSTASATLAQLDQLEELTLEAIAEHPELTARLAGPAGLPSIPGAVPGPANQPGTDLSSLPEALPGLTHLRVLRLLNCHGLHPAIQAALRTRIEELHLDGSTIALDDLRALAALPSLRTLTVDLAAHAAADDDAVVATLAQLRQLARIQLLCPAGRETPEARVRAALPACAVATTRYGLAPR